jgi:benzoate membrane transport protein
VHARPLSRLERPATAVGGADQHRFAINAANVSAGVTCGLWYVFGALPIFVSTAAALHLSPETTSSWLFITCATGAASGVVLSLRLRQPLPITMTIPGWVFLATVGPHYRFAEIVGANLVAGLLILLLGLTGMGDRIMRWLPLPIVLGMFAGSILGYFTGVFSQLGANPAVVGAAVMGFLVARVARRGWLPPIAGAAAAGLAVSVLAGQVHTPVPAWSPPRVLLTEPIVTPGGVLALSVPLTLMAVGIGNVQGLGLLVAKGYRPPVSLVTAVVGFASILNALFGGHQATVARTGVAIIAGDDAGPAPHRYVGNLVATVFLLLLFGYPQLFWIPMSAGVKIVVMTVTLLPLGAVGLMGIGGDSLLRFATHVAVFSARRRKLHFRRIGYRYENVKKKARSRRTKKKR